jgi:TonB family protein
MGRLQAFAIGLLSIGTASCVPPSSTGAGTVQSFSPSAGQPRLQRPEGVVIVPAGAEWPRPVRTNEGPRYPRDARDAGIPGLVVAAFVIDTAGRVELPTVSIVKNATNASFINSVCMFLVTVRFQWPPTASARALIVMPFEFSLTGPTEDLNVTVQRAPNTGDIYARLSGMTSAELAAWVEQQQHCG